MIGRLTRRWPTACLAIFAVSAGDVLSPFLAPSSREGRQGLSAYVAGDYSEAADRFLAAQEAAPGPEPALVYDLGTTAYREGEFAAAAQNLARVAGDPGIPGGSAAYNLGNALYRAGELEGALEAYRQALRTDPGDEDARFNYELTLSKLQNQQEQQDQQNQEDQQDQKDQQGQDQPSNSDQQGQDQERRDQAEQNEEQQQDQGEQQDEQQAEQQESQDEQEGKAQAGENGEKPPEEARLLTPEQAQQLLNAVTPEERELLQARLKSARRKRVEKDW